MVLVLYLDLYILYYYRTMFPIAVGVFTSIITTKMYMMYRRKRDKARSGYLFRPG